MYIQKIIEYGIDAKPDPHLSNPARDKRSNQRWSNSPHVTWHSMAAKETSEKVSSFAMFSHLLSPKTPRHTNNEEALLHCRERDCLQRFVIIQAPTRCPVRPFQGFVPLGRCLIGRLVSSPWINLGCEPRSPPQSRWRGTSASRPPPDTLLLEVASAMKRCHDLQCIKCM